VTVREMTLLRSILIPDHSPRSPAPTDD
jgi:hypothetical protein